jgi:hypothetical protein
MKILRPWFQEGIHYAKIPRSERNGRPWKYKLLDDITVRFDFPICFGNYYLHDGNGDHWGTISPRFIMVSKGYAWNGSSCSPDLSGVLLSSVVHDLLYQFSGVETFPFSRNFADNLFFSLSTTPLAFAYRAGLFLGGWACWGQHEPGTHIVT